MIYHIQKKAKDPAFRTFRQRQKNHRAATGTATASRPGAPSRHRSPGRGRWSRSRPGGATRARWHGHGGCHRTPWVFFSWEMLVQLLGKADCFEIFGIVMFNCLEKLTVFLNCWNFEKRSGVCCWSRGTFLKVSMLHGCSGGCSNQNRAVPHV